LHIICALELDELKGIKLKIPWKRITVKEAKKWKI